MKENKEWVMTEQGKKVRELIVEMSPKVSEAVDSCPYLSLFSRNSVMPTKDDEK